MALDYVISRDCPAGIWVGQSDRVCDFERVGEVEQGLTIRSAS